MEKHPSAQVTTSACFVLDILCKVGLTCPGAAVHLADPLSFPCFTIQSFLAAGAEQAVTEPDVVSGHIHSVYSVHEALSCVYCREECFSERSLGGLRNRRTPAALSLAPAGQPVRRCRGWPGAAISILWFFYLLLFLCL